MQRAIIIGSPGSGKTTFARQLAAKTGLPLIHLDYYYHDPAHNYSADKAAWHDKVAELIAEPRWIIDGNYNATMPARMHRADAVFYFAMPRTTAVAGVIKRRIQKPDRPDMPAEWQETAGPKFLKQVWNFEKNYAEAIEYLLAQNAGKRIIRFQTRGQVTDYLNALGV